jgi:hypothetical protein
VSGAPEAIYTLNSVLLRGVGVTVDLDMCVSLHRNCGTAKAVAWIKNAAWSRHPQGDRA